MFKVIEYFKISLSDLIETLGLVLSRPWKMAAAVYKGGNSLENAILYYFALYSASLLIFLLPFNLGGEFVRFAQYLTVTAFLILAVTSLTLFCGLRFAGVPIAYHKALSITAFTAGAYVLVVNVAIALAAGLMNIFRPDEVPVFGALYLGCLPFFDFSAGVPVITAPKFSFGVFAAISAVSFAVNLYLLAGVFAGLAPFRTRSRFVFVLVFAVVYVLDYTLAAAFAGRNLNIASTYCVEVREEAGIE